MAKSLKEKTVSALIWSFIDKGGQQVLQFVFLFILAIFLSKDEVGLVAVLAIFVAIANILQESGFSSALIRKRDADEADFSTIFYFNISISIACYLILFFAAPWIAKFYNNESILTDLSRFLFLAFVFNAFGIIQNVHLIKKMDFKTNARISLAASFVSGSVATVMAYLGYGVWSLVVQQVLQAFLRSSLLWIFVKWRPKTAFMMDRLKAMYGYSVKLLFNSIFGQISKNLTSVIMGKRFLFGDAGNYSYANKFGEIPQSVIASSLSSVILPLLSNLEDETEKRLKVFRKIVRVISFVCFPLAVFTFIAADSIVLALLQDKWAGVIPMLRIVAVGTSVLPLLYALTSLLQAIGKSGLLLSMEFTRNLITILVLIVTSQFGIGYILWGVSIMAILTFVGEYYIVGRMVNYRIFDVLKDVFPYIFLACVSFLPFYFLSVELIENHFVRLILQALPGSVIYFVLAKALGSKVLDDLLTIIRGKKLD